VIGRIIECLVEQGFCVSYHYEIIGAHHVHHFVIRKYFREQVCSDSWEIDDFEYQTIVSQHLFLREAELHMRKVDEAITQYRLIQEALS